MAINFKGFDTAGSITGGLVYKGTYNATAGTPDLTTASKGDFYIVDPGGTLAGVALNVGDHIVFSENASSPITSSMFDVIDNTDAVVSVNTQTGAVVLDTDDIAEGSSNLYYTNARFDTQLGTKTTDNLTEGSSNLYYTNARFDTQLGTKTTDNLTEGSSNLYYTNARADGRIGAANLTDLNDVDYTAGASIDGYVLEYVHSNNRWEAKVSASAPVTSVNTQTGAVVLDTDDIAEGSSNLYYTNARFDTQLGTKTTDNLTEGSSNLYYTNARFDTQLGTKTTDNLTEGSSNLYYTNARFDTRLGTKSTSDVSEGTNLYYTDARADARIGAANLTDLNDVDYTAGSGINDYVLTYVHANTRWEAKASTGGGASNPTVTSASPSSAYTISTHAGIEEIYILTPSTDISVNLPAAADCGSGYKYNIKNMSTNTLTIDPNGSETIDGVGNTTFALNVQYQSITIVTDGSNWFII